MFQAFCSADAGVDRGRPARTGSELASVTRRIREPNVGSRTMEPAAPRAGGLSGYALTSRSVGAQYSGGPHAPDGRASFFPSAGVCAALVAKLKSKTKHHWRYGILIWIYSLKCRCDYCIGCGLRAHKSAGWERNRPRYRYQGSARRRELVQSVSALVFWISSAERLDSRPTGVLVLSHCLLSKKNG